MRLRLKATHVVLGMLWLVQFVLRNEEKRTRGG